MAAKLAPGVWDLERSENFDEYMRVLGVGFSTRLIGNRAKPRQEIKVEGDTWTITTSTLLTKVQINFTIGAEFDETTADGRKVKTLCTLDGNKLIQSQKGVIDSLIVRDFSKDNFVMHARSKKI